MLPDSPSEILCLLQREALEGPGYPEEGAELEPVDVDVATLADHYETYDDDEDQTYMQQAPNDTLIALQLLRSQFPSKARVGTFPLTRCQLPSCAVESCPIHSASSNGTTENVPAGSCAAIHAAQSAVQPC